jgi:hypothetical protein
LADLVNQLLGQIEAGQSEDALRTVELLNFQVSDPAICNQQTLDALLKARTLALIQRSHLQRRLRSLEARRLFHPQVEPISATWQIDG